ncbi:MAG TPA: hypothetical protein VKR58_07410 [Aquella sp.]|nr:hypothetical protein [Aquella sp.]
MKLTKIIAAATCYTSLTCGAAFAFDKTNPTGFDPNKTYYASMYPQKLKICTQADLSDQSIVVSFNMDGTKTNRYIFNKLSGPCTNWFDRIIIDKTLDISAELYSYGTLQTYEGDIQHKITHWNATLECLIINVNPVNYRSPLSITFAETTGC